MFLNSSLGGPYVRPNPKGPRPVFPFHDGFPGWMLKSSSSLADFGPLSLVGLGQKSLGKAQLGSDFVGMAFLM